MIRLIHPVAGITAFAIILVFWVSTVTAELSGNLAWILSVKTGILWGMLLLITAVAAAGATGFRMGGKSPNPRLVAKRRRMPFIAANGILILVPCAVYLQARAAVGDLSGWFVWVQGLELLAGAVNLSLLGMSIRDGLAFKRRAGAAEDA